MKKNRGTKEFVNVLANGLSFTIDSVKKDGIPPHAAISMLISHLRNFERWNDCSWDGANKAVVDKLIELSESLFQVERERVKK